MLVEALDRFRGIDFFSNVCYQHMGSNVFGHCGGVSCSWKVLVQSVGWNFVACMVQLQLCGVSLVYTLCILSVCESSW